jgi:RNA polymerase sigma-70 factor, ECF subfamily
VDPTAPRTNTDPRRRDEALIKQLATGDMHALGLLYQQYARPVFSLALHILDEVGRAEAVTLDVFADLWAHAATFVPEHGPASTWLLRMTHQRAIAMLRQQQCQTGAGPHIHPEHPTNPHVRCQDGGLQHDAGQRIRAALTQLPPTERQTLELVYFQNLSQSKIAVRLGYPLGTVKAHLKRGMQQLKMILSASPDEHAPHCAQES